jgi:hypothetical protein
VLHRRILGLAPIISVFFGIVIRMFYKDHEPAHFHVEHQGQQAKIDFAGNLLAGEIQSGSCANGPTCTAKSSTPTGTT